MNALEIKKIRQNLGLTQTELAEELGYHLRSIQKWESGESKMRRGAIVLLTELNKNTLSTHLINNPSNEVREVEAIYAKNSELRLENKNGNTFEELSDGSYIITVDEIPFEAHASFLESLENPTYEGIEFPKVSFHVEKFGKGNYKAFQIRGYSMNGGLLNDTPDGASVLARELGRHHWQDGFNDTQYGWIIMCDLNIFHKDITHIDLEKGTITCSSRNKSPEYPDFELELNSLKKIFKIVKRTF